MAGIFIENRRNGGQHAIRKEIISQAETSGIRFVSRFRVERRKGGEFIHDVWPAFQTVSVPRFDLPWNPWKQPTLFSLSKISSSSCVRLWIINPFFWDYNGYNGVKDIIICIDRYFVNLHQLNYVFMIMRLRFRLLFCKSRIFYYNYGSDVYDLDFVFDLLLRVRFEIICYIYNLIY